MICGIGILRILPVYFARLVFPSCLFFAARVTVSAKGCSLKQILEGVRFQIADGADCSKLSFVCSDRWLAEHAESILQLRCHYISKRLDERLAEKRVELSRNGKLDWALLPREITPDHPLNTSA